MVLKTIFEVYLWLRWIHTEILQFRKHQQFPLYTWETRWYENMNCILCKLSMYHCDETHGKFASVTLHKAPESTVKLDGRACSNEQTYQRIRRTRFSVNISSFFSFKFIHTCNRHCVCHITLIAYSNAHSIRSGSLRMHPFIYFSTLEFCHEKKNHILVKW